jgi:hypothetical protein
VQLATLEGRTASVLLGETRPLVTSVQNQRNFGGRFPGGGGSRMSVQFRDLGTNITAKPTLQANGQLEVELNLKDARQYTPEDGVELGMDDAGKVIRAAETISATLSTRLSIAPGQAVVAEARQTQTNQQQTRLLVIVSARAGTE